MSLLTGLFDRILLLLAVGVAGVLPAFIQQYRQRLAGRLDQLLADLAPWERIAQRLHGGDMQALVQHHLDSNDATFVAEADAIQAMIESATELRTALASMQGDLPSQLIGWVQHVDWVDARATWTLFEPQFPLDPHGLLFALAGGGALWLLLLGIGWLIARSWQRLRRSSSRHPPVREAPLRSR